jgi:ABC-type transporter Mla MlaB component
MAATSPRVARLAIDGPLRRSDLPDLFARTCRLLAEAQPRVLRLEVTAVEADAVSMEALARLALAARRHACRVRVSGASRELRGLIELVGLAEVLSCEKPPGRSEARSPS